jgi:hypothetical protein
MIYNAPIKGEDGLYFVKALGDDKRKCLVQLNGVTIADVSEEILFDLVSEENAGKIAGVDSGNLAAAHENCETWFGKKLSENVISGAYTSSVKEDQMTTDRIDMTKVFNTQQEALDFTAVQAGKKCDVIVEFAGLWFAKKAFGSTWNVVQVRVHDDPIVDVYPEEYAFDQ